MRPHVSLDAWVVMPNHVHGIIVINDHVGAGRRPAPTDTAIDISASRPAPTDAAMDISAPRPAPIEAPSNPMHGLGVKPGTIGAIMAHFKSIAAKRINALRGAAGAPVWQRGYYDHIVRDDRELSAIRRNIHNNP